MTVDEEIALTHYRMMVKACYSESHPSFEDVGARGIGMCKRWRGSFGNFLEDIGTPEPGQRLVRKNLDGPFGPDNVEWRN